MQTVATGTLLGRVYDPFGKVLAEVRAPFAGEVLYVVATPPVSEGEPGFVGQVTEGEPGLPDRPERGGGGRDGQRRTDKRADEQGKTFWTELSGGLSTPRAPR